MPSNFPKLTELPELPALPYPFPFPFRPGTTAAPGPPPLPRLGPTTLSTVSNRCSCPPNQPVVIAAGEPAGSFPLPTCSSCKYSQWRPPYEALMQNFHSLVLLRTIIRQCQPTVPLPHRPRQAKRPVHNSHRPPQPQKPGQNRRQPRPGQPPGKRRIMRCHGLGAQRPLLTHQGMAHNRPAPQP